DHVEANPTELSLAALMCASGSLQNGILTTLSSYTWRIYVVSVNILRSNNIIEIKRGLTDGGVIVFERQESKGKWDTSPPPVNGV
nr:hypothetical protein [Tanacetum cinerariifolium]